jgi:alpha-galactosidase
LLLLQAEKTSPQATAAQDAFVDVLRAPDFVTARHAMTDVRSLTRSGTRWSAGRTLVTTEPSHAAQGLQVVVTVDAEPGLTFLHLRWEGKTSELILSRGDAWERSYADLEWRYTAPDRPMPWYFLTTDGTTVAAYGVLTGPASLCFWQRDTGGISLTIDLRNGGDAADISGRQLRACTVVSMRGGAGTPVHAVDAQFCRLMCPTPRLPKEPIFGSNDWNYAYGKNTAAGILRDADLVASLAGRSSRYRPYTVIDDGYQDASRFPDMSSLAQEIRKRSVKPGIWIRPLRARRVGKPQLLLPAARFGGHDEGPAFDPTIPEALAMIEESVRTPVHWGYELIKHDFSTWELFGRWGFQMGASVTSPGWSFHDRSRTNAEIVGDLYRSIRKAAGESTVILGCNTVSHIAAGLFESQRISDDTSGRAWERTRRYGVNGLSHRLAQHNTFYYADPDIVAITPKVPWEFTQQWLDLVARSGTSLFIAPDPAAINEESRRALREAFTLVQQSGGGYPDEPTASLAPNGWHFQSPRISKVYDWVGKTGADPFLAT